MDTDVGAQAVTAQGGPGWWRLAAPLLLLALLAIVPVAAARSRRARAMAGRDPADRVEFWWQDLLERIDDLGIELDPAQTPSQQRAAIRTATALRGEPDEVLTRLCETVLTARYAPPGALTRDVAHRAEQEAIIVRKAVAAARPPLQRLRARLWPGAGVVAIAQRFACLRPPGSRRGERDERAPHGVRPTPPDIEDPEFSGRPRESAGSRRRGAD